MTTSDPQYQYNPIMVPAHDGHGQGINCPVPVDQAWLYAVLERQRRELTAIKIWVTVFGLFAVLGIIVSACSVLLTF